MPSLSREECIKEQATDPTLKPFFELVCPDRELKSVSSGHFLNDGLLLWKWARVVNGVLVDSVVQVGVPLKFIDLVLSISHGGVARDLGVTKTYDNVRRQFLLATFEKGSMYCKTCNTCQLTGKPNQKL